MNSCPHALTAAARSCFFNLAQPNAEGIVRVLGLAAFARLAEELAEDIAAGRAALANAAPGLGSRLSGRLGLLSRAPAGSVGQFARMLRFELGLALLAL